MRRMWGESTEDTNSPIDIERVLQRIHPDDREAVQESVSQALKPDGSGIYNPHDYRLVLDDGSIRWLAANGLARFQGTGSSRRAVELFGTVLDITHRKQVEAALRDSEEHLQALNTELEDRVQARTQELVDSERNLRSMAEVAEQRSHDLKRMAIELSRTEERERQRLATVLHDHLQQLLVAAKIRVEALTGEAAATELHDRLVGIATVLDVAINTTRSMAVDLVPPILHAQGLPAALQWLALRMLDQHGLTVDLHVDSTANPAGEEARDVLFRAASELLLNVIKHAGVSRATLVWQAEQNRWKLEVRDDGDGLATDFIPEAGMTFGLFYVRERLSALGGSLDISGQPDQGTRVTIYLPR